ncbi:RICIN domain-containing protein [Nonomuraea endophytica]|uniref:RICIN domain-containing protein n=1 Tax=Nonomuraea endophytica TaxID=714136 RepID=UPI0037CAC3EA
MRRITLLAATAIIATAITLAASTPAGADDPAAPAPEGAQTTQAAELVNGAVYTFRGKVNTAKCLDMEYWGTGTRVPLTHWDCNNGANQNFRVRYVHPNRIPDDHRPLVMLENVNSGKCLGVRVKTFDDYEEKDRIEQDWCDASYYARMWVVISNDDDGSYTFCNFVHEVNDKRRCMDIPYATPGNTKTVWVADPNGTSAQRFFAQQR